MKKLILMSSIALVALSACSSGGMSNSTLAKDIQANTHFTDVEVTKVTQQYQDSYRSPDDAGTTYVVEATVKSKDGTTSSLPLQVFVAKSDGWVSVEQKDKFGEWVVVK